MLSYGWEIVQDDGSHAIVRDIKIVRSGAHAGVLALPSPQAADALGRVLIKAARLAAELGAEDKGAALLDAPAEIDDLPADVVGR
ncbi:MAG TPA: hypothetical protein VFR27_03080 [Mycobacterium sp.]|nr:hypothetical protein [Mycobacterium sp.]